MSRYTIVADAVIGLVMVLALCSCKDQTPPEEQTNTPSVGTTLLTWSSTRAGPRGWLDFTVHRETATKLRIAVTQAEGDMMDFVTYANSGTQIYNYIIQIHAGTLAPSPFTEDPLIGGTTLRIVRNPGNAQVESAGYILDEELMYVHEYVWNKIEAKAFVGAYPN